MVAFTSDAPKRIVLFSMFVLAIGAAFHSVVWEWVQIARTDSAASHIVLVPLISLGIIFRDRRRIFVEAAYAPAAGVILAVAGVLVGLWGTAERDTGAAISGLVVAAVGGFLLFFGVRAFQAAIFPLAFLGFSVPPPAFVVDGMTQVLKIGSTELVALLFDATGTPYHRQGFVFTLPRVAIEVGDECSGIRSSIALMLTALMLGQVALQSTWKKVLLVLAVLPITILKNGIRIVSLSLLATHVHPSFLVGRLHNDGGVVFFLLALAMLLPVVALLKRSGSREQPARHASVQI
jgi:exosortase